MRIKILTLVLAVLSTGTAIRSAQAENALRMPAYETVTLDNGLTVQLMRHATVPTVTFEMWLPAGASADPAGKEGLANLTAESLRKGAGARDAQAFAQAVDFLGADFNTSVNYDRVRITLNVLAKDFEPGLLLLADAVLAPRFDQGEVAKLTQQLAEGVVEAKDNPGNVLGDYHHAFLYGDHPYGRPVGGTETSLPTLTRADVVEFHHDTYGADRAILTVAGDIDAGKAAARIREVFGKMPRAVKPLAPLAAPLPADKPRVLLVNKSDTPQTWFMIGSLGPSFTDPDYAATELVRTVFGGRFTSWLNTELRIKSGLTYGARYSMERPKVAGAAFMFSFTGTENTKQAIDLALAQLDRLHKDGLSEAELASAKAYFKGQTPYEYETAADMARTISELAFFGLDRSRVDNMFRDVDAVTLADCHRVIERYFRRDNLVFTTIGVKDTVAEILGGYGELRVRENSDPGFR